MGIDESRSLHRNRSCKAQRRKGFRNLLCENLERREVMAGSVLDTDFRLLSVAPNTGEILSGTRGNNLTESPRELIFRFTGGDNVQKASLQQGIWITRTGGDGVFGSGGTIADQRITPAYLDFVDTSNPRVVVARFSQPLPDDLYKVEIFGVDIAAAGVTAVRNVANEPLVPRKSGTDRDTYSFNLELGTKISAVVPQPFIRDATGALDQARKVIEVYFNDSELYDKAIEFDSSAVPFVPPVARVVDPQYYNLIATGDTVTPFDDQVFNPTKIQFDPGNKATNIPAKATLTFADDIGLLGVTPTGRNGTYRLRIGSSVPAGTVPGTLPAVAPIALADPAGYLSGAFGINLGAPISADLSTILEQEVRVQSNPLLLDFPGSSQEPGHRDIQEDRSLRNPDQVWGNPNFVPDGSPEIRTIRYNFMEGRAYGLDSSGRRLFTSINNEQKDRIREILEFYSRYLGVDFQEYSGAPAPGDFNIVVGDLFPIRGTISGPGDLLGAAGQVPNPDNPLESWDMAILDGSEPWDNAFGFGVSQKPLGAETVPASAATGSTVNTQAGPFSFFNTAMHEIGHLLGFDHTFDLPAGTIMGSDNNGGMTSSTGAVVAARLNSPANPLEQIFPGTIDQIHGQHLLRPDNRDVDLYRFVIAGGKSGQIRLETIAERLNNSSNLDTHLTLFKRDGVTGQLTIVAANNNYFSQDSFIDVPVTEGEYFVSVTGKGNEDNNPRVEDTGSGATSQGTYQLRFDFKATKDSSLSEQTSTSNVIGTALDGDGDGIAGGDFNFWFRAVNGYGSAAPSPRTLVVDKAYTLVTSDGTLAQPYKSIAEAVAASRPGDIIRLAGVSEAKTNPTAVRAYEIGTGAFGTVLSDGDRLEVPKGVTLMIDAGAILKMGNSRILVGSDGVIDRSEAAIQVLGTPSLPVYFTSYTNQNLGIDTNPLETTPKPGDWGGIEIRNDFDRSQGRPDREREGIFLNTISNAEMTFGGGLIGTGALAKVTSPIELAEARPLILGNSITRSADSAISADPNSFEETLFTEPRYQNAGAFVPDYRRVGPSIYNNDIRLNTINGLFMRVDTLPGQPLKSLTTHARMDDTEISIVFGENFLIAGTPGGPQNEVAGPNTTLMILNSVPAPLGAGFTAPTALEYLITYVDRFGQESLPSVSSPINVVAGQSVRFQNIPVATGDYVSRRIYRRENGVGAFKLAAVLNLDITTHTDNNVTLSGSLQTQGLFELNRARQDGSLVIDPGMIAKFLGTRLEVGIGATLLAEGTEAKPIIFTSRLDDRYGAGGTFDTNNDGSATTGVAGNWSGILARHMSTLSIDFSRITFAGGESRIPGGFASFSAIEVHQADARITNSLIQNNKSGRTNISSTNRDARGNNDSSAIFVLASQPIIVNNVIRNNSDAGTAAISVDLSSLNAKPVRDFGRATGFNNRETTLGIGNLGPLVFNNRLGDNGLNGMRVRGGTLTTESVWDDTDIVHILQSEVIVPDFHTFGGLRLVSKADSSLVVKAESLRTSDVPPGNDPTWFKAGITAAGRPLDIKDRIGGTVQILGSPGFPVVITSLKDDSIGAGFDDQGGSLRDTNNDGGASTPQPGDWRSVRFTPFSNDRNVDMTYEKESDRIAGGGDNDVPPQAQDIGKLAGDIKLGDENLRLGITLTGSIASPSDMDVYRFSGVAGSTVWLDIDQSAGSLDSVVELIDASGNIMALSDDSITESINNSSVANPNYPSATSPAPIRAYPMDQSATASTNLLAAGANVDFQGTNPRDAGMRVILPGVAGTTSVYYARVRSSNKVPGVVTDPYSTTGGQTIGAYKLHLRLQEKQEIAGSTVRFADLRFAVNGVEVYGNPMHSPLLGEFAERSNDPGIEPVTSALNLGNVTLNDRGGVSISGAFRNADDIDWFNFTVGRDEDSIQRLPSTTSNSPLLIDAHQSVIFDLDYADGLGRANTQLWIFERVGTQLRLVLTGDDSNIQDDQPAILKGTDQTDLTRGSIGRRDAFVGPFELLPGNYVVAVTNKSVSAIALRQFTQATVGGLPGEQNVRLEPLDSVRRIAEDRFDRPPTSPDPLSDLSTNVAPVQVAFGERINSTAVPNAGNIGLPNAVPFNLSDVTLFASTGRNVHFLNALTGTREAIWSLDGSTAVDFGPNGLSLNDLAVAPNGQAVGFQNNDGIRQDSNSGTFVGIDIGNGAPAATTSGIQTFLSRVSSAGPPPTFETIQVPNNGGNNGIGMIFDGLTFSRQFATDLGGGAFSPSFWGVARRGSAAAFQQPILDATNATIGLTVNGITKNVLYRLNNLSDGNVGQARNPVGQSRSGGQQGLGAGTNVMEHGYFVRAAGTTTGGVISGWTDAIGTVTGLATLYNSPSRFYAVTDQGELMGITVAEGQGQRWSDQYEQIFDPETGTRIQFQGLTAGPRNLQGGRYADMLFGIATNGRIYAFNTAGQLQPIFPRGASFIQGPAGVNGIDFSSLDVNLWHANEQEASTAGHGRSPSPNNSRVPSNPRSRTLKFGYTDPDLSVNGWQEGTLSGRWSGIYDVPEFYDNLSLPGGAMGAIESDLIDLRNYSAGDQPMLYFNYQLSTEGTNSPLGDSADMLDSLRVYGVGEDGVTVLLATNNSARTAATPGRYDGTAPFSQVDEFDVTVPGPFGPIPVNGNQDVFGRSYLSQELFDGQGWRQARVNLAPFAGKRDVKLRFEFSTGGDFRAGDSTRGGQELIAVAGDRLVDGQTFTLTAAASGTLPASTQTFEFDMGLVLNLPSSASLADGDQIRIDTTDFTFRTTPVLPTDIPLIAGLSPVDVASIVRGVLQINGLVVATNSSTPNVLNVRGLPDTGVYQILGADPAIITGLPGVNPGNIAVNVTQAMTAVEVRDSIRTSLALAFNDPLPIGNSTNIDVYPVRGHSIVLHRITIGDRGPLQATLTRVGDLFGPRDGAATPNLFRASAKARNNTTTLVRLDDFIIGFAERGEMVVGATPIPTDDPQFQPTYEYELFGAPNGSEGQEIETGAYQLEIRTAPDYGKTEREGGGQRLALENVPNVGDKGRTFDTNDRLVKAMALDTTGLSGQIVDGYTFTLSNGVNLVTFEFNVFNSPADPAFRPTTPGRFRIPLSPNATDGQIAQAIRDAINDDAVRAQLGLTAQVNGEMFGTPFFNDAFGTTIQLNGNAASDLFGGSDFTFFDASGAPTFSSLAVIRFGQETQFGEDVGDANIVREQGQLIISGATVLRSSQYGINLIPAPRDLSDRFINMEQIVIDLGTVPPPGTLRNDPKPISTESIQRSYPGSVRNMITLNNSRVAPGPVIVNNVLAANNLGGIRVGADSAGVATGVPDAPVTVARIVNNTIYGRDTGINQSGIEVGANTSPTILSNILANLARGINVANDPALLSSIVIGANLYQGNANNILPASLNGSQSFPIALTPAEPLFMDPTRDRFYLKALSRAIDSSLASLEDRNLLDQVRVAIGLPTSPIIAPEFDAFGLLRSDDPTVSTPGGLGSNVFADRGAIDRVDLTGPLAILQRPLDNDSAGNDLDRTNTYVQLKSGNLDYFEILIDERQGTGPDPLTINQDNVVLTENGRILLPGVDYVFGYSFNSRAIRLTPLAGFWRQDSVYELTLINKPTVRLIAPDDAASRLDGQTFTVNLASGGTRTLELNSGFILTVPTAGVADGQTFTYTPAGGAPITFEFNLSGNARVTFGNRVITYLATDTADQLASKIAAAVNPWVRQSGWSVQAISGGRVVVGGNAGDTLSVAGSSLTLTGNPGVATGAIPVRFLPIASFDAFAMANALTQSLNQIGSGVKAYALAGGVVFVEGINSISGMAATLSIPAIQDLAGNNLQANRPNSLTQFTILMPEVAIDFGDAVERTGTGSSSNTLIANNGARHGLYPDDARLLVLGSYADGDADGQPSAAADADDFDSKIDFDTLSSILSISSKGPARLIASASDPTMIGKSISITRESSPGVTVESVTYEFTSGPTATIPGARPVNLTGAVTAADVASRLQTVILSSILDGSITGIHASATGDVISLGGTSSHRFNLTNATGAVKRSQSGTNEILVQSVAGLASDMKMSITDGNGNTVGFQVINSGSPSILEAERVAISVDLATVTPNSFATALAAAINQAVRDLRLKLPTVTVASNAVTVRADDEDGVDFVGVFNAVYNAGTAAVGGRPATPGVPVAVSLTASSTGFVDAWIDWNQDNDFEDVGERILNALPVIAGVNTFFVSTPASAAVGYTTARFRLSSTGGLFTNGVGIGGEVEDHLIEVLAGSPPVAVNDAYTVNENGRLSSILSVLPKGVLANDYDADDPTDALPNDIRVYDESRISPTDVSIQPLVAPRFGDLVLSPDGSFTYTPNPHFNGVDSFVYRTTDSRMVSANTATVTLTVHKVNDDPKAFDDVRTIDEDTIVEWTWANLTANDFAGITTLPQRTGDPVGSEILGYDSINVDPLTGRAPLLTGASDRGLGSERDQNLNIVDVRLLSPVRLNPDEIGGVENVTIVNAADSDRNNRKIRYAPGRNYNNLIAGPVLIEVTIEDEELTLNGASPANNTPRRSTSTLTVNINAMNDRPVVILDPMLTNSDLVDRSPAGARLRLIEDQGSQSIPVSVTAGPVANSTAGGADDENGLVPASIARQNVLFNTTTPSVTRVRAIDPSLFSVQPTILAAAGPDVARVLSFTLAPDVNSLVSGPILIEIYGMDDGQPAGPGGLGGVHFNESVRQTLTLDVAPVNDAPFATNDTRVIDEDTSITISSTTLLSNDYPGHNPSVVPPRIDNEERDTPATPPEDKDEDQRIRIVSVQLITASGVPRAPKPGESLSWPTGETAATGLSELRYTPGTNYNNLIDGPVLVLVTIEDTGVTGPLPLSAIDPKQATSTLTININAMNDRPVVILDPMLTNSDLVDRSETGSRLRLIEDPGAQSIPVSVTAGPVPNSTAGGADDENGLVPASIARQNVLFNTTTPSVTRVRAIDPSLFSVQPTILAAAGPDVARVLSFTLAPDVNSLVSGPILIEIYGMDDGQPTGPGGLGGFHFNESVRQTLTLDVAPVNDAPFAANDTQVTDEDTSITISSTTLLSNDYPGHNPSVVPPRIDNEERDTPATPPEDKDEDQRIRIVSVQLIDSFGVPRATKSGESLSWPTGETTVTGLSELRYTPGTNYNNLIDGPVLVLVTIEDNGVTGIAGDYLTPSLDPKRATSTLTININAMNDRPIVTLDPGLTLANLVNRTPTGSQLNVLEDPGLQSIPVSVTAGPVGIDGAPVGMSGGADDENGRVTGVPGQTVSFNTTTPSVIRVRALNPAFFAVQPTITPATGSSVNRTLSFTLAPDVNSLISDSILIEIYGMDDGQVPGPGGFGGRHENESIRQTLTLRITEVNDAPQFTIPNSIINIQEDLENSPVTGFVTNIVPGPATATDELGLNPPTPRQTITFEVTAVDPTRFNGPAGQPRISPTGQLTYDLAPDVNRLNSGNILVRVVAVDNGPPGPPTGPRPGIPDVNRSIEQTFTIVVAEINDAPEFTIPSPVVNVFEDNETVIGSTPTVISKFAISPLPNPTNLPPRPGPSTAVDEVGQTIAFDILSSTNLALFRVQPSIDPLGNLSFVTQTDQSGTAVLVVRLRDNGAETPPPNDNLSDTATFTIVVRSVNDAPEFTVPSTDLSGNITVVSSEDEGVVTRPGFTTNMRPGPITALDELGQVLQFDVVALDPSVFEIQPSISTAGTLTFKTTQDLNSKPNSLGTKDPRVVVTLRDNGVSGPPPNTNLSIPRTFTMSINPTNDPPVPRLNHQIPVNEDSRTTVQAADLLVGATPGPQDEILDGQTLRVTNINTVSAQGGTILPVFESGRIIRFDYIPPLSFVGQDTVTYVITDDGAYAPGPVGAAGTLTINVGPINDPPEFTPGPNVSVLEDAAPYSAAWATNITAGPPSAVDENTGPGRQTVTFEVTTSNDSLFAVRPAISSTGVLTFTLAKDANGPVVLVATAVDNGPSAPPPNENRSRPATFTITVQAVNDEPDFNVNKANIPATEGQGAVTVVDVLNRIVPAIGNNSVPPTALDEVTQSVTITTTNNNPSLFTVQPSINSSGMLTFTTAPRQAGSAVVQVFATDSGSGVAPNRNVSVTKSFTITVSAVNDAPTAVDDSYSTSETAILTRVAPGLLANDTDPESNPLVVSTFQSVSQFGAQVSVNPDGSFTYNPTVSPRIRELVDGQTLQDTFTYRARDVAPDSKESNLATVTITVSGFNDAPVAVNDGPYSVQVNTARLLPVLDNDTDVDTPLNRNSIEIGILASNGTAVPTADGRIRYTPNTGFLGTDTFTYRVRDSLGKVSNEATVTIRINTPPIATPDSIVVKRNTSTAITVLSNDSDVDGSINVASVQIVSAPASGSATPLASGQIQFTPNAGFIGTTSFQYVVSDNDGAQSNAALVTVQVVSSLFQNQSNNFDVDGDKAVSPLDALIVINLLNAIGNQDLNPYSGPPVVINGYLVGDKVDVNGDNSVDPLDVLAIINFINSRGGSGEGEGSADVVASDASRNFAWTMDAISNPMVKPAEVASLSSHELGKSSFAFANAAQPISNMRRLESNVSLADYLASMTEDEDVVEIASVSELPSSDQSAVDEVFADLFRD